MKYQMSFRSLLAKPTAMKNDFFLPEKSKNQGISNPAAKLAEGQEINVYWVIHLGDTYLESI